MSTKVVATIGTVVVGAIGGLFLAFRNKKNSILSANTQAGFDKKPVGFQALSLTVITHVRSISPALGDWLLDINLSPNGHGWYPDPDEPGWMRLHYGLTSISILIKEGRALLIRLGEKEGVERTYHIDGRVWEEFKDDLLFNKI